MNTVTIYADQEDAENLAIILVRSENTFTAEKYDHDNDRGYLFTVIEREEDDNEDL